jgi:hypothetical protein
MKHVVRLGNCVSKRLRESCLSDRGETQWKPSYWQSERSDDSNIQHQRDVFFKERQAVDIAWAKLSVGMLKFILTGVGLGVSIFCYFSGQKKNRLQQQNALLLEFSKESRHVLQLYKSFGDDVIIKQLETVLRANHVKWEISQTTPIELNMYGLYVPTEATSKGKYRVDDLEIVLALSERARGPYVLLSGKTQRPRQLDEISDKFNRCVTLFAQLEQLAILYSQTGMKVDATFFPIDIIILARSIVHKNDNPLLVASVHSFFQRQGERGRLALGFMERVSDTSFQPIRWTDFHLDLFFQKYDTKEKIRKVPDDIREKICDKKVGRGVCESQKINAKD